MERIFEAFERAKKELYLVGGAVRELARGVRFELIDDLDFCTDALPEQTLAILKQAGLSTYDVGIEFGTVGTVLYHEERAGYPKDCQITTYRSEETYRRGSRHPEVRYGDTIQQDLKRRDFSINSIAMDAQGRYIDPYDGLGDLRRGVLRVVGDPDETLLEDPLRMLRVGRFMAKLGFDADQALRHACAHRAEQIQQISRERWLQEMTKLLCGAHASKGLEFLAEVGLLEQILPEVEALRALGEGGLKGALHKDIWAHTLQVVDQAEPTAAQRWGALLHDIGKPDTRAHSPSEGEVSFHGHERLGAEMFPAIAERFTLDGQLTKRVAAIIAHHGQISSYEREWSNAAVRRLVRRLDPHLDELLAFARADLTTSQPAKRREALARHDDLKRRIEQLERDEALRPKLPPGFGRDLIQAFSLKPSPRVGELIASVEEAILEGEVENNAESEVYIAHLRAQPD